jgi:spermidine synthase
LVYQLLWTRQLTLVLGSTVAAVSIVVATFMAGLGLGSAVAGRNVDRLSGPQLRRVYAGLEAGIVLLALALPLLLRAATPVLASLYQSGSSGALTPARVAIAALVLLFPTTLMGATLPVLTAAARPRPGRTGRAAGGLYAANTLGAVLGCLATPFVLLPVFGVRRSTFLAAGLNLLAAALVLAARGSRPVEEPLAEGRKQKPEGVEAVRPVVALAVIALSGGGALAHEVAWTRALILLIGPSPYAFAFILAAVIAGIALGSAVVAPFADRVRRPALALAVVQVAITVVSFSVTRVIGVLPVPVGELVREYADRMSRLMGLELAGVLGLLLVPSALFGAAFPLAVGLLARSAGPGQSVGRVYSWNTAGAIAGALLAGFLALPALGAERTLHAAAAVHALAGAMALAAPAPRGRLRPSAAVVVVGAALAALLARPAWDPELISGGPYKYGAYAEQGGVRETLLRGELIYHREGPTATVSVKRVGGTLSLAVDGKVDATSSADMPTQRLLAHLPLLLHPSPRTVAVIGLGSGVTAGSALTHAVDAVDVVEISPEVVEATAFFRFANNDALADPRLRLTVGDGRNHLLLTDRRYDVIISEPSNPWMAGVSALYTRDFFLMARTRLAPGGLFCQWAHVYNLRLPEFKTVVATFTDAFPHAALFLITEADVLLLGSAEPLPGPEGETLARRMAPDRIRRDLADVYVHGPFGIAALHALETPALAAWAADAPRHTDDHPFLEFRAARTLHADTTVENGAAIREAVARAAPAEPWARLRAHPKPGDLVARALALELAQSTGAALASFREALERDPRHLPAYEGLVRTAAAAGKVDDVERELAGLVDRAPIEARIGLALLYHGVGRPAEGLAQLEAAAARGVLPPRGFLLAADIQQEAGNLPAADAFARAALKLEPGSAEAEGLIAAVTLEAGLADDALKMAEAVLARAPHATRALEVAAIARAQKTDRRGAQQAFEALLEAEPNGWSHCNNFGVFLMEGKDYAQAARMFERSVDIHPGNPHGWRGLREAALALDDRALLARADAALARLKSR